jgi:hypothetical protein
MIFKTFRQKIGEKMAFLTQSKAKLFKKLIITLVFEKKANFCRRKLSKIAENCDQNIDPSLGEISPFWLFFTLVTTYCGKITYLCKKTIL